jgi:hypothetical protein
MPVIMEAAGPGSQLGCSSPRGDMFYFLNVAPTHMSTTCMKVRSCICLIQG